MRYVGTYNIQILTLAYLTTAIADADVVVVG